MIYLFAGDDTKKKLEAYEKFVKSLPKGQELFSISRNNFDPVQIESFYSGASLFAKASTIAFQNILEHEEGRDFLLPRLKLLADSANSFIFLEGKILKPTLEAFEKSGAEVNIFALSKEKKEKYNNFLVANAFERRDKLNMWISFREAMDLGVGMEEIVGVLFWKMKDMLVKRDFQKFSETELKDFASRLSYLLPEARKEGRDAEAAFEQFLLEVF